MIRMIPLALVSLLLAVSALAGATTELPPLPASAATKENAESHDVQHGPGDQAAPVVRWQSDEPLRLGMRRVRTATEALSHAAHGHLDAAQVNAVARELKAAVHEMFAQCRLAPAPDAALHPLLAQVLEASTRLAADGFDAAVLDALQAVLARYVVLFEDEGWSAGRGS